MDNKRLLISCTAYETVCLWNMRLWYINVLWTIEIFFQDLYIFQITCKCWSFFWFRNHLYQLRTICYKCNSKLSEIPHAFHCLMRFPSEMATGSLLYSLLSLSHLNLPVCYATLVPNRFSNFSMIHL